MASEPMVDRALAGDAIAQAQITAFCVEVADLHTSWILWRRLFHRHEATANEEPSSSFAAAKHTGDVMRHAAPEFFRFAGWHMLTGITATICRLCDPAQQGKYQNLSVEHVLSLMDFADNAQAKFAFETNVQHLHESVEEIRPVRDKLIAHCDRAIASGLKSRPDPEIDVVRIAVERLVRFVHNVEQHLAGKPVALVSHQNLPTRTVETAWILEADRLIEVLNAGLRHFPKPPGN